MEKRKFKYLLISVCLALLIVSIGGVVAGASSTKDETLAIQAETLDINGKVGIAFAVPQSVYNANDGIRLEVYNADPALTDASNICTVTETLKDAEGNDVLVNGCVVFVTDGFDPYDFANSVYARLETDTSYGVTRQTGVLELAYKMLNNLNGLETLSTAQTTRKNLYLSLIDYHDKVQQVFNPDYTPYTYITVENGIINGNSSGAVVTEGDLIDVVSTFDASSVGMSFVGWSSDGTVANLTGTTFTVSDVVPGEIQTIDSEPMFAEVTSDAWLNSGKTQKTVNSIWNQTGVITTSASVSSSYHLDDDGNNTTIYKYRTISQLLDEDGLYLSIDHDKTYAGAIGAERFALPQTLAANSSTIMSFDLRIAEKDYNGDGFDYTDCQAELNTTGSALNTSGSGNLKFNIGIAATASGYSGHACDTDGASNDLSDLQISTNASKFPYFRVNTSTRISNGSGGNSNDKYASTTQEGLTTGVWHNVQIEYITNDTYVSALKFYIDGELIATRTMGDETYPLSYKNNAEDTAFPIADVGAICFSVADSSTYRGAIDIRNLISYSKTNAKSATDVKADDAYTASSLYVGTFNASSSTVNLQAWNTLEDGIVGYGSNDTAEKPILYNSAVNEILQYAPYSTTTKDSGQSYYLFENPLYGKTSSELAGKTLTFSYKVTTAFINCDGDETWQENADNGTSGSSMISYMLFGFIDGDIAKSNNDSAISAFSRLGVTTHSNGYRLRVSDILPSTLNTTTCTTLDSSGLVGGVYATVSVAVNFNDNGDMGSVTYTVTANDGTVYTYTVNDSEGGTDSKLDDFTAVDATDKEYFGMQSTFRGKRANTIRFTGFTYSFN